jgi:hypothetical protein
VIKMRIPFTLLFICYVFILTSTCPVYSNQQITIDVINDEIVVYSDEVKLGDIAGISGGTPDIRERAENVFLTRSPKSGQHVRLSREALVRMIARAGFGEGQFILNAPRFVKIQSDTALVRSGDFVKAAQEYLQKNNLWTPDLRVTSNNYQISQKIPAGTLSFKCQQNDIDNDPLRNRYSIRVTVLVDGKPVEDRDIIFISQRQAGNVKNMASPADNSSGVRIRRGDALRIQFVRKNMVIEAAGTAAEAASPGSSIRVTVNSTKKTFNARLIDSQSAVVDM